MATFDARRGRVASLHERALLLAAQREDRRAQEEILRRYEPLARAIARRLRVPPGCDRGDIVQEARVGLLAAIRAWRPERGPFPAFARLCVLNQVLKAIDSAGARKHQLLSQALPLDCTGASLTNTDPGEEQVCAVALHEQLVSSGQLADPVATLLGRERLDAICARLSSLTAKERIVLVGVLNDTSHRALAAEHGWSRKAVTLAMRRVRHKLAEQETLAA